MDAGRLTSATADTDLYCLPFTVGWIGRSEHARRRRCLVPYQYRGEVSDLAVDEVKAHRQGRSPDAQATVAFTFARKVAVTRA